MMRRRLISFIYFSVLGGLTGLWVSVNYLMADEALMLYLIGAIPYGVFALITGLIRRKRSLPKTGWFSMNFVWFGLQAVVLAILFREWYLTELDVIFLHAIGAAVYGLTLLAAYALRKRKKPTPAGTEEASAEISKRTEICPPISGNQSEKSPAEQLPEKRASRKAPPSASSSKKPARRRNQYMRNAGWICAGLALFIALIIYADSRPDAPEAILAFVERYPEAASFAENYTTEHGWAHDMSVADECEEGVIPLFIQWDERWAYEDYGGNYLGLNGCGPTCMSMIVCGLTGDTRWNPYEMAQFADDEGYYYPGSGTSWSFMTEGAREFGLHAEEGEMTSEYILKRLSEDTPMIASMRPGDFTTGGHYIVLTGIDKNGNILVNDPNSPEKSAKSWTIDRLLPQIKGIWRYWA